MPAAIPTMPAVTLRPPAQPKIAPANRTSSHVARDIGIIVALVALAVLLAGPLLPVGQAIWGVLDEFSRIVFHIMRILPFDMGCGAKTCGQ